MDSVKGNKIDWRGMLFLTLTPPIAFLMVGFYIYAQGLSVGLVVLFFVFYALSAMSITGGYHRLFAHKSYEASFLVKLYYVLFGAGAFQNSILQWCTDHRIHHVCVDSDKDPYSIKKGFWHAHILWMFIKEEPHPKRAAFQRDFVKDKLIMWQDKYYAPIAIFMGWIVPGIVGWLFCGTFLGGFIFGGVLRMVAVHHGTFLINSLSHWWGKQTYTDTNSAKDNLVAALLTFGEGYHNFHHYFANDYRNGIKWYHWDPTKWLIYLESKLGLVKNLKTTPTEKILEARLNMEQKKLSVKIGVSAFSKFRTHLQELQLRIVEYQKRIGHLKNQCKSLKRNKTAFYKNQIEDIKLEIASIKLDGIKAYREWNALISKALVSYKYI